MADLELTIGQFSTIQKPQSVFKPVWQHRRVMLEEWNPMLFGNIAIHKVEKRK